MKEKYANLFLLAVTHFSYDNIFIYTCSAGVDVQGYFVWAAFDTFEFHQGFSERMGLIYIDFNNNLNRVEKQSARWYRWFLTGKK